VGAAATWTVWRSASVAWHNQWPPAPVPTFDVADYVLRAYGWARAWTESSPAGLLQLAATPDPHPALHPALLGAVLAVWPGAGTESGYAFSLHLLALATLPLLGWVLDRGAGAVAGLVAAAFTTTCLIERSMVLAPMTEPLAQLVVLVALTAAALAATRPGLGWWWLAGTTFLAASATRYHLGPMLAGATLLTLFSARPSWREALIRGAVLLAPMCLMATVVAVLSPDYVQGVRRFLTNADSGIATLSMENLVWFGGIAERQLMGTRSLAWAAAIFGLVSVALRARVLAPGRTLGIFVGAGLVAMFIHPLKVDRNVFALIGPGALFLLLPWFRLANQPFLALPLALGAAAGLAAQVKLSAASETEQYYSNSASVSAALKATASACDRAERVVLVGAQRDLSEQVIQYALRTARCNAELLEQPDYTPTCLTPIGPSLPECQLQQVRSTISLNGTQVIHVEATRGPAAKHRRWMLAQGADFAVLVGEAGYHARTVELADKGLRLTVWSN
jgi:hypothetical protein